MWNLHAFAYLKQENFNAITQFIKIKKAKVKANGMKQLTIK